MAPRSFTDEQVLNLRQLATDSVRNGNTPVAQLMRMADDWGIDYAEVAREYTSLSLALREKASGLQQPKGGGWGGPTLARRPVTPGPAELVTSPVADVKAAPGALYVQGFNWPLIEARLNRGMAPGDIARLLNPPMSQADYKRVEEGRLLPSADHIAQICHLLGIPTEEAFVMAGPDAAPKGSRSSFIKGMSILGIMRVRRRLTFKAMAEQIQAETSVEVPAKFLSQVEAGSYALRGEPTPMERVWLNAVAAYLEIPVEWVLRQVPPDLVKRASTNTRQLHGVLNQTMKALPSVNIEQPHMLLTGGEGNQ